MAEGLLEQRRKLVERIPLFARLEPSQLETLASVMRTKKLRAREELCHKGDAGGQVYVIVKGRLKATTTSEDGTDVVLNLMDEGEVVGELALLTGGKRTATVVALEPAELLVLDRRDFLQFLKHQPDVSVNLLSLMAERVARISELVEDTVFLNLPARLAKKLLFLVDSYGDEREDGVHIQLKLSQAELGNMVGTTRESINKQIRAWTDDGMLVMERGLITIYRMDQLERLAGLGVPVV